MEKDRRYLDTLARNIEFSLDRWARSPDDNNMAMLEDNIENALDTEARIFLTVKAKAFRKENLITYFPEGMNKLGKKNENGSMTFEIGNGELTLFAQKDTYPFVVIYAGSCSLEGRFAPSDIESVRLE